MRLVVIKREWLDISDDVVDFIDKIGVISWLKGSDKEMWVPQEAAERGSYFARKRSISCDTSGGGMIRMRPNR